MDKCTSSNYKRVNLKTRRKKWPDQSTHGQDTCVSTSEYTSVTNVHRCVHNYVLEHHDSMAASSLTSEDLSRYRYYNHVSLHNKYKVIHNDIKMDNICLSLTITSQIKVVIIDFGKACNADQGKLYKLTDHEKEQYKACHPHIAPDLRNGLCRQSVMSDVYALGRIINTVNGVAYLQNNDMQEFSETCMHYNEKSRPEMSAVENYFDQLLHMNVQ